MRRVLEEQGYRVTLDLAGQVLRLEVPEETAWDQEGRDPPLAPAPPLDAGFLSAAVLAHKGKQLDDGLYAAVELALQEGVGGGPGKPAWLERLAAALASASGEVAWTLEAARALGGGPEAAAGAGEAVRSLVDEFLADPLQSRPLGFYTWSEPLAGVFRQDRMLQRDLEGAGDLEAARRALLASPDLEAAYRRLLRVASVLTGPLVGAHLLGGEGIPRVLPPSRSHESELIRRLYGDRPIPEGFQLIEALIARIRAGTLDLAPRADSGWYDHQAFALEPLVAPERFPEAAHLALEPGYCEVLEELFKALMTAARETHVKQLEIPAAGCAPPGEDPPPVIDVAPALSLEPLVTHYLRRAASYRFVHEFLVEVLGEGLGGIRRVTPEGRADRPLAEELAELAALYRGAARQARRELGLDPGAEGVADDAALARFREGLTRDPDLARDGRFMVPVFYDQQRQLVKVWAMLGWTTRRLQVSFATPPAATVEVLAAPAPGGLASQLAGLLGMGTGRGRRPQLHFCGTSRTLAFPVMAEVYVRQPLDREAFRALCDQERGADRILARLGGAA